MARSPFSESYESPNGDVISNVQVFVYTHDSYLANPSNPTQLPVYTDPAGGSLLSQPLLSDSNGQINFWADPATFVLVATKEGYDLPGPEYRQIGGSGSITDVTEFDPAEDRTISGDWTFVAGVSLDDATVTPDFAVDITGKVDRSTLTTKGDIYAATAADTPARLAVGSDGQLLGADSAATSGVAWKTPVGSGTFAARPAAATALAGHLYVATDIAGGTMYRCDGATWTQIAASVSASTFGTELGYAEITSDFTTASTTLVDVTGLTTTVTIGTRPVIVRVNVGKVENSAAGGGAHLRLMEDATSKGGATFDLSGAAEMTSASRTFRLSPAAGSTTYKVQTCALTSGTVTLTADSGAGFGVGPASIQVIEC